VVSVLPVRVSATYTGNAHTDISWDQNASYKTVQLLAEFYLSAPLEINSGWPQPRALVLQEGFSVNFDYLGYLLYVSHCIQHRVFFVSRTFLDFVARF
jgi:hypothetical protein